MTLYKRGKVWWVEYMADGKRYRQSTHSKNKSIAQAFVDNINTARKMPTLEDAIAVLRILYRDRNATSALSIDAIWDTYLQTAKAVGKDAIAKNTLERRRLRVARFIKWLKKNRPTIKTAEAVTAPIAAGFASELASGSLKSKTRINIISELNTVWKMLGNASAGISSPWVNLRPADTDATRGKAFTDADAEKVMEAAVNVGKNWREVCILMRHTGMRYGDAARIMWKDIDFEKGIISITPKKTSRHGISVKVPMVAVLSDALKAIRNDSDYVFPLHAELYGNRGHASREALSFREVLTAAGIADAGYTVHSWRHTAATKLASVGASKDTRKAILGHTTDAMAEHYDHDEHLAEKRKALEAAAGITGPSSL